MLPNLVRTIKKRKEIKKEKELKVLGNCAPAIVTDVSVYGSFEGSFPYFFTWENGPSRIHTERSPNGNGFPYVGWLILFFTAWSSPPVVGGMKNDR